MKICVSIKVSISCDINNTLNNTRNIQMPISKSGTTITQVTPFFMLQVIPVTGHRYNRKNVHNISTVSRNIHLIGVFYTTYCTI